MNAVNMDTGYVNYLSEAEKLDVLRWIREALEKMPPFVAAPTSKASPATSLNFTGSRWTSLWAMVGIPDLVPKRADYTEIFRREGGGI